MKSTRTSAKVPGTSCITLPSVAATSAPCSCGWQPWGFPRSGAPESHVLATVDAVLGVLHRLVNRAWQPPSQEAAVVDFADGQRLLAEHTHALLGSVPAGREVRIMVTMPSEAAEDYLLVHNLLQQGMDCMRINCAHDDAAGWLRMIEHLRQAERSLGRSCRVVMDLAGPKLRTGPLEPGPAVLRIRPHRDVFGRRHRPRADLVDSRDVSSAASHAGERLAPCAVAVAGSPSYRRMRETHRRPQFKADL